MACNMIFGKRFFTIGQKCRFLITGLMVSYQVACGGDCQMRTQTVELVPGDAFFNVQLTLLEQYQKTGYDCSSVAIRDGQGREIGSRYTCTKCD